MYVYTISHLTIYTSNSNIFTVVTVIIPNTSMTAVNKPWLWPIAFHIIQPNVLRTCSGSKERTVTVSHTQKSQLSTSNRSIRRVPNISTDCSPFVIVVKLQATSKSISPCIHHPQSTIAHGCMHTWGGTRWDTRQSQLLYAMLAYGVVWGARHDKHYVSPLPEHIKDACSVRELLLLEILLLWQSCKLISLPLQCHSLSHSPPDPLPKAAPCIASTAYP